MRLKVSGRRRWFGSTKRSAKSYRRGLSIESLEFRWLLAADFSADKQPLLTNEVLVQFAPNASAAARFQAHAAVGGDVLERIRTPLMQRTGAGDIERVSLGAGMNVQRAIEAIQRMPGVLYAGPNYIYKTAVSSNDTYYTNGNLWGMYGNDSPLAVGPAGTTNQYGSQAEKAWNDGITGSPNVFVGIIDEGIQFAHPELANNIWTNPWDPIDGVDNDGNGYVDDVHGWDFFHDDNSIYDVGEDAHGTHVAGTIGGEGGNNAGVVGMNWDVTMISAKFLGPGGGYTSDAIQALDYLTDLKIRHGINLVASNNSWGGGGYSQGLHDAIIRSANADILFVAAAGNSSSNNDAVGYYPSGYNTSVGTTTQTAASYDSVISVAAIDSAGAKASFSSYGATTVDIGAPGVGIWSSVPTNTYSSYNGTSMATPHVTGAIALYASVQPFAPSGAGLKAAILSSATPTASMAGVTVTGGRLNVYAALQQAAFLDLDADSYTLPDTIGLSVQHPGANLDAGGIDTVSVHIKSTTETSPETVILMETGVSTGLFSGSIALASGTVNASDGTLQAAHGDTITATYTTLGQSVTATVDAMSPTISGLGVAPEAVAANVTWTTNEAATTEVRYGTSAGNLNLTSTNATLVTNHSAALVGLTPLTTYYYQVTSRDATGNASVSGTGQFTTLTASAILFVDDDQGATYERFFKAALNANGLSYDVWNAFDLGMTPSAADLARYGKVIWNTGYDYSAPTAGLSTAEQTAIAGYLDGGGRIFLSGQDILFNGVTTSFRTNYLKIASYLSDEVVSNHTEFGLAGNPISAGMSLTLTKPSDFPSLYVDDVTPVAGAEATFEQPWGYSSVNYRGDYATGGFGMVFMTFPFEAISATAAAPNNQSVVMQRIMDYLSSGSPSRFVLTAPSVYTTSESGSGVTFGVRLASPPTASVVVPVSSSDTSEGSVSVASLTFTTSNWSTAQNITVTGVNDAVDDGDIAYRILLGAASSSDPNFNGGEPIDLYLTNLDNDTAGITVSAASGTTTTEAGGTVTFTVRLNSQPTANVTIPLSSSDTTEGTAGPSTLTFTPSNWNTAQTVTVTGVDDYFVDGNIAYTAVIGVSSSTDALYSGLNPADISLTNVDNDTAGVTVSAASGTTTTEAGGTVTFTVKLDSQPTATVTIPISSSDTTEGTVSTSLLTFTTSNWNTAQTVTVTGVNDNLDDGDIAYTVVTGAVSSTDPLYSGRDPVDIVLTNLDNDTAGITVSAPSGTTTTEAGGKVTFTVKLATQPTANVTISVSSSDTTEGAVSTSLLTFTTSNWSTAQTVTVTGVDDAILDGNVAYSVVIGAAASTDPLYNGIDPADIGLTNADNDAVVATKFYVVDDATTATDRTYEYSDTGAAVENYGLAAGNTASRGIASTAAGDKIWVVDKSRTVYVYNNSGGLLHSWTAGTLATTATVEGITTDGTNIWIADSKSDKIFYYAGGASRTSGTWAATASYVLGSGNTNPKDLVYGKDNSNNGFIWVVNDASTDKVFRYAVTATSGAITLLNSWNLNTNNKAPTGITLDPDPVANSGDLWVLNNGTTKQVFRYTNGRTVTGSTSPASSAVFTVSGLTSPQGIADPPPAAIGVVQVASAAFTAPVWAAPFSGQMPAGVVRGDFSFDVSVGEALWQSREVNDRRPSHSDLVDEVMSSFENPQGWDARGTVAISKRAIATLRTGAQGAQIQLGSLFEHQDSVDDLLESVLDTMVADRRARKL